MKVIAAFLLAVLGGNPEPSAADIKNILASVGAEAEDEMIDLLLGQVKGQDITELMAVGRQMMPAGTGGGLAVNVDGTAACGGDDQVTPVVDDEPKKEETDDEDDMILGLFD